MLAFICEESQKYVPKKTMDQTFYKYNHKIYRNNQDKLILDLL